jgi:hypothetical protein
VPQQLPFRWQNHGGDSYPVPIHGGETIGPGLLNNVTCWALTAARSTSAGAHKRLIEGPAGLLKARLGMHQRRPPLLILAIGERKRHPHYR